MAAEALQAGCQYLVNNQNSDGGWGGGGSIALWLKKNEFEESGFISSVEETALAVEALATVALCGKKSVLPPAGEDQAVFFDSRPSSTNDSAGSTTYALHQIQVPASR